eukprot:TRINITY_DN1225_c0_g2_i3.p1 TRINITY_DN1225_c0_g2~~TRINITY_DN1225_c0_g2_i3.p1  ORF type:complete len:717 (+),score=88.84 TRINITY_DN1225_c0_g2_i3:360-2510(+)
MDDAKVREAICVVRFRNGEVVDTACQIKRSRLVLTQAHEIVIEATRVTGTFDKKTDQIEMCPLSSEEEFNNYLDPLYAGWKSFTQSIVSFRPNEENWVAIRCSQKPPLHALRIRGQVDPATCSASLLSENEVLSLYPLPAAPTCFFPSKRLRDLMESVTTLLDSHDFQSLARVQEEIERAAWTTSVATYCKPLRPEEDYTRQVYNSLIQVFSTLVPNSVVINDAYDLADRGRICLGGAKTKPESCVRSSRIYVMTGEAKGVDGSLFSAYAESFQAAADGAMFLFGDGLPLQECVVPSLVVAGDNCVQLCASFLAEPCFPCFVLLTDPINLHTTAGRRLLAAWFLALAKFAAETGRLYALKDLAASNEKNCVRLDLSEETFLTPVRAFFGGSATNLVANFPHRPFFVRLLETYEVLHSDESCREHVLFPLGWGQVPLREAHEVVFNEIQARWKQQFGANGVDYPRSKTPLVERQIFLLFPTLTCDHRRDDGWQMASSVRRPTLRKLVEVKLSSVVVFFARVVTHLDIRGPNVMVRFTKNGDGVDEVEVRVIDWEYAVRHGEAVPMAIRDLELQTFLHAKTDLPAGEVIIFDEVTSRAWMLACVAEDFRAHMVDVKELCRAAVSALKLELEQGSSRIGKEAEAAAAAITALATTYGTLASQADDEVAAPLEAWMKRAVSLLPEESNGRRPPVEGLLSMLSVDENPALKSALDALKSYC